MLKFIKHHLDSIAGIEVFPIISFIIFFTFFLVVAAYVFKQRREYFDQMGLMPLDENQPSNQ